jgi:hypothetical protein
VVAAPLGPRVRVRKRWAAVRIASAAGTTGAAAATLVVLVVALAEEQTSQTTSAPMSKTRSPTMKIHPVSVTGGEAYLDLVTLRV